MALYHLIIRQVLVKWPIGSREEVQYWFWRRRPSWISIRNDLNFFLSTKENMREGKSHLDTSNEVWVNCPFGSGEKVQNKFSTWLLGRPPRISDQNDFSYFCSTSHPDTSYQFRVNEPFYSGEEVQQVQDGNCGGQLVFPIEKILAIFLSISHPDVFYRVLSQLHFNSEVTLMLPTKFRINQPFGSGKEATTDFQDGRHLGYPIRKV